MAPHSSTLAWKIPWAEEPGRLQSMGSLRVERDWATSLSLFIFMHWRRKWQPIPVFLPSRDGGAWWAAVYGVAQSRTRLKWLSSSSMGLQWDVYDLMSEQQQQKSRWLHLFPFLSLLNQTVSQNFLHTSWWLPLVTWQLPREQRLFVSFQVLVT